MKLYVRRQRGYLGEHLSDEVGERPWFVYDPYECVVIARYASHRAALHYALWKSGLKRNYGAGC